MSGFICSLNISAGMSTPLPKENKESAGKVARVLGVIAAIAMPFAAPAIWAGITASGAIAAGLGTVMSTTFGATLANVIGSAAIGAITQAGLAYAGGARGRDVWSAAGTAALSAGLGAYARGVPAQVHAPGAPAPVTTAATSGASAIGYGPVGTPGGVSGAAMGGPTSLVAPTAATATSPSMTQAIMRTFGNLSADQMRNIGAALVNAAVNGTDMGRLNGLVAQQKAELDALKARGDQVYEQRIAEAQKISFMADRMDPQHSGYMAMADAAGIEANQFAQMMRNIAVRQGGSFDAGQQKAYMRGHALHAARTKALAFNQAYKQAEVNQAGLRQAAAGLMTPNQFGADLTSRKHEIEAAAEQANRESRASTAAGLTSIFQPSYKPPTSAVPQGLQAPGAQHANAFDAGRDDPFNTMYQDLAGGG